MFFEYKNRKLVYITTRKIKILQKFSKKQKSILDFKMLFKELFCC